MLSNDFCKSPVGASDGTAVREKRNYIPVLEKKENNHMLHKKEEIVEIVCVWSSLYSSSSFNESQAKIYLTICENKIINSNIILVLSNIRFSTVPHQSQL